MLYLTYFTAFADVEVSGFCVFRLFCVACMSKVNVPSVLTFRPGFLHAFQRTRFAAGEDPAFAQVNSAAVCGFGEVFLHVDMFVTNQFVAVLSYVLAF